MVDGNGIGDDLVALVDQSSHEKWGNQVKADG
jgi:hypothetical protein